MLSSNSYAPPRPQPPCHLESKATPTSSFQSLKSAKFVVPDSNLSSLASNPPMTPWSSLPPVHPVHLQLISDPSLTRGSPRLQDDDEHGGCLFDGFARRVICCAFCDHGLGWQHAPLPPPLQVAPLEAEEAVDARPLIDGIFSVDAAHGVLGDIRDIRSKVVLTPQPRSNTSKR